MRTFIITLPFQDPDEIYVKNCMPLILLGSHGFYLQTVFWKQELILSHQHGNPALH